MGKTLYLHVGLHKTGTSSIQNFLANNRHRIYQYFNLYYPHFGSPKARVKNQSNLNMHRDLFPVQSRKEQWEEVNTEIYNYRDADILISEEFISLFPVPKGGYQTYANPNRVSDLSKESLALIREYVPDRNVKIVLCLRRMDLLFKSFYVQCARRPCVTNYKDFFENYYHYKHPFIFQSRIIEKYIELVGVDNLLIYNYDKKSSILSFFSALNKELPPDLVAEAMTTRANKSINSNACNYLSSTFVSNSFPPDTRNLITETVLKAFQYPKNNSITVDKALLENEILKIDCYCPGYKNLFNDDPVDFSYPELEVEPFNLLVASLLYRQLDDIASLRKEINDLKMELIQFMKNSQSPVR